jgi:hypothetical protein
VSIFHVFYFLAALTVGFVAMAAWASEEHTILGCCGVGILAFVGGVFAIGFIMNTAHNLVILARGRRSGKKN